MTTKLKQDCEVCHEEPAEYMCALVKPMKPKYYNKMYRFFANCCFKCMLQIRLDSNAAEITKL